MTDVSAVSPKVPKITAAVKTKSPGRVAQGKKLAAIRAEKRRSRELEGAAERDSSGEPACDRYQKITFYFTMVSSVATLLSIPFVYRYLTESKPVARAPVGPSEPSKPVKPDKPETSTNQVTSDMIEFD